MQRFVEANNLKRNSAIEALRFLFMLQICVWHNREFCGHWESGYLGVEFFYILSGFYMFKNLKVPTFVSPISFTLKKLKKFYVAYFLGVIIGFVIHYRYTLEFWSNGDIITPFLKVFAELLMIQGFGLTGGGYNAPLWFFSGLIYGGGIVYSLLRYYRNFSIRVLFPVWCILFYSLLFSNPNSVGFENWNVLMLLSMPFFRGVTDMMLGVLLCYIYERYTTIIEKKPMIINVFCGLSVILYIGLLFSYPVNAKYALIFIPLIILSVQFPTSLISRCFHYPFWSGLGQLAYYMFIIHILWRPVSNYISQNIVDANNWGVSLIFICSLIPVSYLFKLICDRITSQIYK